MKTQHHSRTARLKARITALAVRRSMSFVLESTFARAEETLPDRQSFRSHGG
jgi:hypothetical protein